MANLVVCCDGTWNTPELLDHDLPSPTNVVKLYNAVIEDGTQQRYYHPGVGTGKGFWTKLLGGSIGEGLDLNIKSAYHWLAVHYAPGDDIFVFGFSRGAFTARSLCGFIAKYGLLDLGGRKINYGETWRRVDRLFDAYRKKADFSRPSYWDFHPPEKGAETEKGPAIHFLGVWDTVGALGVPKEFAVLGYLTNSDRYRFHDTKLSPRVRHARHAVAIDEKRASFEPTLWWGEHPDMRQLWFPGCHGDVGGGHYQRGLADGALGWMIAEATAWGLKTGSAVTSQARPDPLDITHESYVGIYKRLKSKPRTVPFISPSEAPHQHRSTTDRAATPSLIQGEYWPTNALQPGVPVHCPIYADQHWNETRFYLEKGRTYDLAAIGQWVDLKDKFAPSGKWEHRLSLGDFVRLASSIYGLLERLARRAFGLKHVDFWFTRRVEHAPWFALMGFIASAYGRTETELPDGQTFLIGDGVSITPEDSGYLYCFANDAWQKYGNNHGSVNLSVTLRP